MTDELVVAPDAHHQQRGVAAAARRAELAPPELWLRYFALGGAADPAQVEDYLQGGPLLPATQADLLAQAVNEWFDELLRRRRAPYSRPVRETRPDRGPLAALVELLDGTHLNPPERFPLVLEGAGATIGVGMTAYLVDHDQRRLVPVLPPGERRPPLEVASTLAGRAFRQVEMLPTEVGGPRLWVPLLDGTERLGVIEVVVDRPADLYDPVLREQCGWIAHLAGHLVSATTGYGDGLEVLRRARPRTAAAELIWSLLPPLTAATAEVEVAGLIEPVYAVGGDAFDYALAEDTATVAIFDAAGHSLLSGMVAAAALAAYRAARRAGAGLFEQARAIDETVGDLFGRTSCFVTGVLMEIETATGRLRYLAAGHPAPFLVRDAKVVKVLDEAGRPPFGILAARNLPAGLAEHTTVAVGEETLQPGDCLMLYTDGIVEARDRDGEFFGEDRLTGLLHRMKAAASPRRRRCAA